jgi:hypothetical protein
MVGKMGYVSAYSTEDIARLMSRWLLVKTEKRDAGMGERFPEFGYVLKRHEVIQEMHAKNGQITHNNTTLCCYSKLAIIRILGVLSLSLLILGP